MSCLVLSCLNFADKFCDTVPQRSYVDQIEHKQCVMNRCTCHPSGEFPDWRKPDPSRLNCQSPNASGANEEGKKERHPKYIASTDGKNSKK